MEEGFDSVEAKRFSTAASVFKNVFRNKEFPIMDTSSVIPNAPKVLDHERSFNASACAESCHCESHGLIKKTTSKTASNPADWLIQNILLRDMSRRLAKM